MANKEMGMMHIQPLYQSTYMKKSLKMKGKTTF